MNDILAPITKEWATSDDTNFEYFPYEAVVITLGLISLVLIKIVALTSDNRYFGIKFHSNPYSLTEYNSNLPKASLWGFWYVKLQNQAHLTVPKCWLSKMSCTFIFIWKVLVSNWNLFTYTAFLGKMDFWKTYLLDLKIPAQNSWKAWLMIF